jgi:PTS system nitrogen regulatory IIA component
MLGPQFLSAERVRCHVEASSRKDALQSLSKLLASGPGSLTAAEIYERLDQRERLGSTCVGKGLAIPHSRDAALTEPVGALLLLDSPVDFDAGEDSEITVALGVMLPTDDVADLETLVRALRLDAGDNTLEQSRSPEEAVAHLQSRLALAATQERED